MIKKKAWPELFERVLCGQKKFDLRLAEFDIREGDILLLEEWDPEKEEYTGRKIQKEIKFVLKTKDLKFWNDDEINKKGFIVMGF